ncbi:hypothetical protein DV735_g5766, partial [Chaetothyriales sp. CBS 134920]
MDFKSLMAAQISKAKSVPSTTTQSSQPKFVRRADIEAERQKAYVEEQARLEAEREERAAKKRKLEEEEADRIAQREAKLKKLSEAARARREAEEREERRRRRERLDGVGDDGHVIPDDQETVALLYRQIASYLTLLLTEWSTSLSLRAAGVKESASGRAAYQSYTAVLRDLTPLYRKLEDQSLDPDLLPPLCEIISHIQKRQYVKANDAYLRLSIGKAAWPIGVTMVGIHERSAREKLHESDKQAHIMSDEVTRKMLQSLKRCISFAQTRWPPDDLGQLMG